MININQLTANYKIHTKSRTEKHASYPARFAVPDDLVKWDVPFPSYRPSEFNAPVVLDVKTPWADPQDIAVVTRKLISFEGDVKFNENGIPLNPIGRTGLKGRGVLGKWGANFAVDGIITTINPSSNQLQVLTITRTDTGETALPDGMVDFDETAIETRNRELEEELSINPTDLANNLYEKTVYSGYVDDPRNTDNAWMETTVIHTHLAYELASTMRVCAGDDASDYKWVPVTSESISSFYANHGLSLLLAIKEMVQLNQVPLQSYMGLYMEVIKEN
jgi:ADP-ribose pyrophosphatase